jgi:hypothetical protein
MRKIVNGKRLTEKQTEKFDFFMEHSEAFKTKFERYMAMEKETKRV